MARNDVSFSPHAGSPEAVSIDPMMATDDHARAADLLACYFCKMGGGDFATNRKFSCRWEEAKRGGPCFSRKAKTPSSSALLL